MANTLDVSQDELNSILAEVSRDLDEVLKAETENLSESLAKADEEEMPEGDESAPAAPPADESAPPAEAPMDAAAPPADESAPPAAEAPADPAAEEGPMDVNALTEEYAQLPPEELKMHYMAAKAALYQTMGAGDQAEQEAPAPADPAAPPAPAPEASAPPPAPAMKGEMSAGKAIESSPGNGGLAKSEEENKSDAQIEELNSKIDTLAKALDLALGTPMRKAVTNISYVPKTDETPEEKPLSKSEFHEKLNEKAQDPNLSKSDRQLINKFCVGVVDVAKIEHLLK